MDPSVLQDYSTLIAALDEFELREIPALVERRQYEEFGTDQWDLPLKYETLEEMLQQTQNVDTYIKDLMNTEETPRYFVKPGYEDLRDLSIDHAIRAGYYRDEVFSVCSTCARRYAHFKYFRFLITEPSRPNRVLPLNVARAARIMNYRLPIEDCCLVPGTMRTEDYDGNPVTDAPIKMARADPIDSRRVALYYAMSKGLPVVDLLEQFEDKDRVLREYQVPVIDEQSRRSLDRWLQRRTGTPPRVHFVRYNDINNLHHDRMCVYLRSCTSCGHPTVYAYAYYLLAKLGIDKESLFADFQILLPCCRMTFMSPTFKPLPYNLDEREDFYEGIGIKYNRSRQPVKTIVAPHQTVTVKRMDRDSVANRDRVEEIDRGVEDA